MMLNQPPTPGRNFSKTGKITIVALVFGISFLIYFVSSNQHGKQDNPLLVEAANGKALSLRYCQSCHLLPDPALLPKDVWSGTVLPVMGLYLGTTPVTIATNSIEKSLFPSQPLMSAEQWQQILKYYVGNAPEKLPAQQITPSITWGLPMFDVVLPPQSFLYGTASITSYSKIDTLSHPHQLIVGNSMTSELLFFNDTLGFERKIKTHGPVVDIFFENKKLLVCNIGKEVAANDSHNGTVRLLDLRGSNANDDKIIFDSLARPVQIEQADLNGDGKKDYVISQFGNLKGKLTWMENMNGIKYEPQVVKNAPGPIRTIIRDSTHDGLEDLWTLFAQGDECIVLFTNKGHGKFDEKNILRFPPSYGSSSFDLIDFDGDGDDDIIYTCGDNGDYSRILKPYHGVYIYLNDGKNNFSLKSFYPVNGCYKAICYDFDGDGDLDIATISYFPSSLTPWESFLLLKNEGNFTFKPYTLPEGTPFQKGVTMDAGDINGDGKMDLVLGSGYYTSDSGLGAVEPLFIVLKGK